MTTEPIGRGHAAENVAQAEFFSKYAQIYMEREVVRLSRVIADAGLIGPDSIARAVLAAGYRRTRAIPPAADQGGAS